MRVKRPVAPEPPHRSTKLALILSGTLLCVAFLLVGGVLGVPGAVLATAAGVWSATCGLLAAWRP